LTQGMCDGAMWVSFKMRKRREIGKNHAKRGQRRRAARAVAGSTPRGEWSLRAAISPQPHRQRPHNVNKIAGWAQKGKRVGELNLMGLPGESMRRKVPFKALWRKLIAAWKTTSPHEVGPARTKSRDSWTLMLITGQRLLRFCILKEAPMIPRMSAMPHT
jgi:hypothetical protein